jgi:hypothetical protein
MFIKKKERLSNLIDHLDKKAENTHLSEPERLALCEANENLCNLRRDEETKWAQRAKVKHVQEGGNNTKYFHLIANGKHRRKKIFQLEQDEGTIVGEQNLKVYISEYYKGLFGPPDKNFFTMTESETSDSLQLSKEENSILIADLTHKEVFDAIMQMEKNKSPRSEWLPGGVLSKN